MKRVIKAHPRTIYLYKSAIWDKIREESSELSHPAAKRKTGPELTKNNHTPNKVLAKYKETFNTKVNSIEMINRAQHFHCENDWSEYKLLQKEIARPKT